MRALLTALGLSLLVVGCGDGTSSTEDVPGDESDTFEVIWGGLNVKEANEQDDVYVGVGPCGIELPLNSAMIIHAFGANGTNEFDVTVTETGELTDFGVCESDQFSSCVATQTPAAFPIVPRDGSGRPQHRWAVYYTGDEDPRTTCPETCEYTCDECDPQKTTVYNVCGNIQFDWVDRTNNFDLVVEQR